MEQVVLFARDVFSIFGFLGLPYEANSILRFSLSVFRIFQGFCLVRRGFWGVASSKIRSKILVRAILMSCYMITRSKIDVEAFFTSFTMRHVRNASTRKIGPQNRDDEAQMQV